MDWHNEFPDFAFATCAKMLNYTLFIFSKVHVADHLPLKVILKFCRNVDEHNWYNPIYRIIMQDIC